MTHFTLRLIGIALFILALILPLRYALGQGLSLTVTPPLFQLTIGPGEQWASTVKVVNNNDYDVTYYAQVVNFDAEGESGKSTFTPLITNEDNSGSLAGWVTLEAKPLLVKAGESAQIPFSVRIPGDAPPGGHYAAILVGTQPGLDPVTGPSLKVATFVSSLLFVRVKGEVHESGRIREFVTDNSVYTDAQARFALRFENTGNTHLKPQGEVIIYNMWGKKRGAVLINQKNNFGNVLPESVRRFEFGWDGTDDVFDIGRYRAEVTLAYGDEARQSATATSYFWIVPLGPVLGVGGTVLIMVLALIWFIRRYIRRALMLEHERLGIPKTSVPTFSALLEPIREGVVDLRAVAGHISPASHVEDFTFQVFLKKYRLFLGFVLLVIIAGGLLMYFFSSVLTPERPYKVNEISTGEEWAE